ncbi:hypothetical protein DEFDS_P253 (plasmid) [Deferribacter desulfuricans SSM1]|uniref:Uncharacterized protein n=1 Tax=Deferribacter desulfuricans (strain DSM 14783 / JCM 11476 / NBRC 101012 / SSM1) TaxID=639282 RepID=D3PF81_DEFDS|nr:hypothetical protein [Deferribacter desulfuricans]BAI81873.1 hypothetical protein DEFDS_P253 [Deferribacter desulfuricans SSM1]
MSTSVLTPNKDKLKKASAIIGIIGAGLSGSNAIAGGTDSTGATDSYIKSKLIINSVSNTGSTISQNVNSGTTTTKSYTLADFNKCPTSVTVSMPIYLNLYRGYGGSSIEIQTSYGGGKCSVSTTKALFNRNITFYKTTYYDGNGYIYYSPYSADVNKVSKYSSNRWDIDFSYCGRSYKYYSGGYPSGTYRGKAQYKSYSYTVAPGSSLYSNIRYGAIDMYYTVKCNTNGSVYKSGLKAIYYTRGGDVYSNHSNHNNHNSNN